jgi:hypothetical protein
MLGLERFEGVWGQSVQERLVLVCGDSLEILERPGHGVAGVLHLVSVKYFKASTNTFVPCAIFKP